MLYSSRSSSSGRVGRIASDERLRIWLQLAKGWLENFVGARGAGWLIPSAWSRQCGQITICSASCSTSPSPSLFDTLLPAADSHASPKRNQGTNCCIHANHSVPRHNRDVLYQVADSKQQQHFWLSPCQRLTDGISLQKQQEKHHVKRIESSSYHGRRIRLGSRLLLSTSALRGALTRNCSGWSLHPNTRCERRRRRRPIITTQGTITEHRMDDSGRAADESLPVRVTRKTIMIGDREISKEQNKFAKFDQRQENFAECKQIEQTKEFVVVEFYRWDFPLHASRLAFQVLISILFENASAAAIW